MQRQASAADIAVIGMAGAFPGAPNVRALWSVLLNGQETISRFTAEELTESGVPEDLMRNPHYVPAKGIVAEADYFDNEFFGYSPREASLMDPQLRLMHECAWGALEDAGYDPYRYPRRIGIFAGAGSNPFWHARALQTAPGGIAEFLADKDYLCSRIAHKLDLRGPAIFVHTACSTSLVAVHLACRALLTGDCEMALAGGASVKVPQKVGYLYQEGMIVSSDGHCRSFDAQADGAVPGEGVGLVVLKPLSKALLDRDHVYAVIKGSAVNNDGRHKLSFTAPSVAGQVDVIRRAHRLAKVDPRTIGMVEAHGTGTLIGDPIEVQSLCSAFQSDRLAYCCLTSIKPNVGHLDHAAGIAGLIKAVLCLRHRQIPATLHFKTPIPELQLESSPFYVSGLLRAWESPDDEPRRAAVTSLGVGGTNVHMVLEEFEQASASVPAADWSLLITSARTEGSLQRLHSSLGTHLSEQTTEVLSNAAHTLQVGRASFAERHAFLARSVEDARRVFEQPDELPRAQSLGHRRVASPPRNLIFLFPGQGEQYVEMTKGLYEGLGAFKRELDECFAALKPHSRCDFRELLFGPAASETQLLRTEVAQPLLFAVEYALSRVLMQTGVRPTAMLGHSVGELTAACVSGALSLQDACSLVCTRGRLMQALPPGKMLHVGLAASAVSERLPPGTGIAAVNSAKGTVVSGEATALEQLAVRLATEGVSHKFLRATHAFHSPMMAPIAQALAQAVRSLRFERPAIPYISNVTGTWADPSSVATPEYWVQHAIGTVHFSAGLRALLRLDDCTFVEVGPGSTLCRLLRSHDDALGRDAIALTREADAPENDRYHLLRALGRLWLRGVDLDWSQCQFEPASRIPLPSYAFERRAFPLNGAASPPLSLATTPAVAPARSEAQTAARGSSSVTDSIARLFASTLGLTEADIANRDFFELGGDSLTAMEVIAQIHQTLGAQVPLASFFDDATAAGVAACVEGSAKAEYQTIHPTTKLDYFRLSAAQRRLYVVHQTERESAGYNETLHTMIEGELDRQRLENAFAALIARHESLRTYFVVHENTIVQRIHDTPPFSLELYKAREHELSRLIDNIIRPFNLAHAPLFRVGLIELAPQKHLMVWDFHHIIIDGVAMSVLYHELIRLYAGEPLDPPPTLEYKDYAEWQQDTRQIALLQEQEKYWLGVFADSSLPILNLPTDYPRSRVRSFKGDSLTTELTGETLASLRSALQNEGVSLFMALISAYYVLLSKLSGCEDICVGTIVAGRRHAALAKIVGVFVNTVVLRGKPRHDLTFREFLAVMKRTSLEAFENQEYPLEGLIEKLGIERDTSRNALFDAVFVLQNMEKGRDEPDPMGSTLLFPYWHDKKVAKFDLTLTAIEGPQAIYLTWDYISSLFTAQTIRDVANAYETVLVSVLRDTSVRLSDVKLSNRQLTVSKPDLSVLSNWSL